MCRPVWVAFVALFALLPVSAAMHVSRDAGVQFWSPDTWKAEYDEEGHVLTLVSEDESIGLVVFPSTVDDMERHLDDVAKEVEDWLTNVEVEDQVQKRELHGLTQFWVQGTGKAEGDDVLWSISLVVGAEKPVVFCFMAEEDAFHREQKTIEKVNASIEAVLAQEFEHQEAGVRFRTPGHWEAEADGDVLTLTSERQGLALVVFVTEAEDLTDHLDEVTKEADRWLTDVDSDGEVEETEVHGLTAYSVTGEGKSEGEPVLWDITLVLGAKKPVVFCFFGADEAFNDYLDTMAVVYGSIEPIKGHH